MNHPRQISRLAILGLLSIVADPSWVPSSHAQVLPATEPASTSRAATPTDAPTQTRLKAAFGQLPLTFEENRGQTDEGVRFLSRGDGYMLFLTQNEAVLTLRRSHNSESNKPSSSNLQLSESAVLRLKLAGANAHAQVLGIEELSSKSNYFIGNDPTKWRTNVPTYSKVRYSDVYPGVDLVYYGNQSGQLEYDFVVAPGADPKAITLNVEEGLAPSKRPSQVAPLRLDSNGDLMIRGGGGDVRFQKPVVYQRDGQGRRHYIDGRYLLQAAESGSENPRSRISFEVAAYDHEKPLIIDPAIAYSTYLTGSIGGSVALFTDSVTGHVYAYVAGNAGASDFPIVNAAQPTYGGGGDVGDAFVTKFDPAASGAASVIYSTYLGGSGGDSARGIAVDSGGNAYVSGMTASTNFPMMNAYQTTNKARGGFDISPGNAFLAKLSSDGSTLLYSTYFGGSSDVSVFNSNVIAIALDPAGHAYIAGTTQSSDLPTLNPYQAALRSPNGNAFAAAFDTTRSGSASLLYSTYLGGSGFLNSRPGDGALAIAVDAAGTIHLGGTASSADFPIANGFQTNLPGPGSGDGFLCAAFYARLNPGAIGRAQLLYSTYLGGPSSAITPRCDAVSSLAVDSSGNAYLTGATYSNVFPTTPGSYQTTIPILIPPSAFVTKINSSLAGSASLIYSTYLSNRPTLSETLSNTASGIAVDVSGNAFVVGYSGPGLPLVNPVLGSSSGVLQTVNAGQSWTGLTHGLSDFPIRALAVDTSTSPRTLYAGTGIGSVFASADGGLNWNRVFQLPNSTAPNRCSNDTLAACVFALAVDPTIPSVIYAGTTAGVYKSSDRGATWSAFNSGLSSAAVQGVRGLSFDGGTLYAGAGDGLYKLNAGASVWAMAGLAVDVHGVAFDPTTTPHTLYASSENSGAYKSADGGTTWNRLSVDPNCTVFWPLAVDTTTSPATLYAEDQGYYDQSLACSNSPIWKSIDGGNTWASAPGLIQTDPSLVQNDQHEIPNLVVDPTQTPSIVYLLSGAAILESKDGANSWTFISPPDNLGAIALDVTTATSTSPATLYAGTEYPESDAFVAELNPTGSSLLFSTYLGGILGHTYGNALALDAADNIYVTGFTNSLYLPKVNAYQTAFSVPSYRGTNQYVTFFTKLGSQSLPTSSSGSVSSQVGVQTGTLTITFPDITGSTTSSEPTLTVTPLSSATTATYALSDNLGAYDISTTASYSGSVTLCFQALTVNDLSTFNSLQLIHVVNGTPVNITTSRTFSTRTVCGSVTSFSPLVLVSGTPRITWNNPANIIYGTALSGTQLNAAANVQGTFTYTPSAGTVLNPGAGQTLSVTFTPTNRNIYSIVTKTVTINVLYATSTCNGDLGHTILQPINADGSSVFKLGSTVPTKFRVCDVNGTSVGLTGTVAFYRLVAAGATTGLAVDEQVYSTATDSTFRWDSTAQQWIFNQGTGKNNPTLSHANTMYVFRINLKDGTSMQFQYGLK